MSTQLLIIIGGLVVVVIAVAVFYLSMLNRSSIIKNAPSSSGPQSLSKTEEQINQKKEALLNRKTGKQKLTLEEKLFRAGIVSEKEKKKFNQIRMFAPIVVGALLALAASRVDYNIAIYGGIMGALLGLQLPVSILERKTAARSEEIMYYLPLVIEQISIGVSSSLDIGPCLQRVVTMADERDSHNVVTELLRIVVTLARTGLSLEDGLTEVGRRAGQLELKHTFMALAQVTRHGGEITRQLQELADAVSNQRETKIEAKIKKLELEATGPVAMVFMGFMLILLIGIGMQMMKVFAF